MLWKKSVNFSNRIYFVFVPIIFILINIALKEIPGSYLLWSKQIIYILILYAIKFKYRTNNFNKSLFFLILIFNVWAVYHLYQRFNDFGGFVTLDVLPYGFNLNSWAYVNLLFYLLVDIIRPQYLYTQRAVKFLLIALILASASRLAIISILLFVLLKKKRRATQILALLGGLILAVVYLSMNGFLSGEYGRLISNKMSSAYTMFINQRVVELTLNPIIDAFNDYWQFILVGDVNFIGHSIISSLLINGGIVISSIYLLSMVLFHLNNGYRVNKRKYSLILLLIQVGMISTNLSLLTHYTVPLMYLVFLKLGEGQNESNLLN